jgi:hypothetical protein
MATDRPNYQVGEKGVNLVASPLHTPTGGLLSAQNVEFIRDQGIGGIGSRGGLAALNANALAGPVMAVANIPLVVPDVNPTVDANMIVACDTGETETWKTTLNGTVYTDINGTTLSRMNSISKMPATPSAIPPAQRVALINKRLYFSGNEQGGGLTGAELISFADGEFERVFRVPGNPSTTAALSCRWMSDLLVANGLLYFGIYDEGGVAPNHKGRVLAFNPETFDLRQVGAYPFGNGATELAGGFPFCLGNYLGQIWAGTNGLSGAGALGRLYRTLDTIDTSWTLDHTAVASSGYFTSLCEYNGDFYAATTANDAAFSARVEKRTAAGVWSTSFTGPDTNTSYCSSLIVFDGNLYAAYFKDTVRVLVKKFDGTTWTTDKDVGVDFGNLSAAPGMPFVAAGSLYWPFTNLTAAGTTGFILKRTSAGSWSQVLTGVSLRGAIGAYYPTL